MKREFKYTAKTLSDKISLFKANFLTLKFNEIYDLEFRKKNYIDTTLGIKNVNKIIADIPYTNFLCLVNNDTLTCDNHIDQLISTLNSARNTITDIKAMLSKTAFRRLYCPYVHSVISCGMMFVVTPLMVLKC
jgi:hypothetical protein